MNFDQFDARSDVHVFTDIIREAMSVTQEPEVAAIAVLNSERFAALMNKAYGDGFKDGLDSEV